MRLHKSRLKWKGRAAMGCSMRGRLSGMSSAIQEMQKLQKMYETEQNGICMHGICCYS